MRVLLIPTLLLVTAATSAKASNVPWYKNALIYQIYQRSFLDLDGDGIGDLKGISTKVDYLASLGVSAVWLAPVQPSPNEDFGYDITDFMDINPEFGTLKDFTDLINVFKAKGIKVLIDFVPNHSSTQHHWFVNSENRNDTNEKYSDFYVWKDPRGFDKDQNPLPPNNWLSVMNTGSAWKWSNKRKQFYLHNFLEHQADLNYSNPTIHNKMEEILKFWMLRGVDGFRVDAMSLIYEDPGLRDEPKSDKYDPRDPNNYDNLNHIYTRHQPMDVAFVKEVRFIVDRHSRYMNESERLVLLECHSPIKKLLPYYGDAENPGGIPLNYLLLDLRPDSSTAEWEKSITDYYKAIGDQEPTWMLGNHYSKRVASRWSEVWVDLLHMIMLTLRGTAVTYYGEEIGLEDNSIRYDQLKDRKGIIAGQDKYTSIARDFQRAPVPWNDTNMAGFTKAPSTWIPLAPSYWKTNVATQESAERSHLKVYRALTKLRKGKTFIEGDCQVKGTDDGILYVIRSLSDNPTFIAAVNLGDDVVDADLQWIRPNVPDQLKLIVSSINYPATNGTLMNSKSVRLPPKTGLVLST